MLQPQSKINDVHGLTEEQKTLIKAYIQGAVYCWAKNRDEAFAARDLFGGDNFEWDGTPLYTLYLKHRNGGKNHEAAINAAGIDVGWLLKSVLHEDKRTFKVCEPDIAARYQWVADEP